MTITAIETEYRGYRFRSRLEARWAVAFDHLNIKWVYESQGYLVGESRRPYLPDFWLPRQYMWVEVKGDPGELDESLMVDAVQPGTGLPGSDAFGIRSVLILGDIPAPDVPHGWLHWRIAQDASGCGHLCECDYPYYTKVTFKHRTPAVTALVKERIPDLTDADIEDLMDGADLTQIGPRHMRHHGGIGDDFVTPQPCGYLFPDIGVHRAYRAARSARFEHGESGTA